MDAHVPSAVAAAVVAVVVVPEPEPELEPEPADEQQRPPSWVYREAGQFLKA